MSLASSFGLSTKPNLAYFHSLLKFYTETTNRTRVLLIFRELLDCNEKPNKFTFALLVKACASCSSSFGLNSVKTKVEANQIHTHLVKSGADQFTYLSTALLDFYMKLGCLTVAQQLFDDMRERDVVSWNALICGFSRNGCHLDALELFVQMCREGFSPSHTTLVSLVPSCGRHELIFQGKTIHGFGIKTGINLNSRVKNAFTSMYAKCGHLEAAERLFQEMAEKSVVSWNTMIGAYGQNGFFDEAMFAFKQMREESVEANPVTLVCLLSANANPKSSHSFAIKTGLMNDCSVITSLVCEYARRCNLVSAEVLNKSLPQKNLVSLTAILSSHAERGNMLSVVEYFAQIQKLEMRPDAVTMVSILHGITDPAHFEIGLAFHGYGLKSGLSSDNLVANGLISMYSKFDQIEAALSLFFEIHEKPLISWNSLISGCVQAGRSNDAFELFCQMKMFGHGPDAITIASLLSGCGQLGYLQFGERFHNYVLRNNIEIESFLGTALIDMYTKCGRIERAEKVFKGIKEPCLVTWNAMISGYSLYGLEHKALSCFSEMREQGLNPDHITFLGVLAACTHGGLVHEGRKYFEIMRREFNMVPGLQHYACLVSLLGRTGLFEEALILIKDMEIKPDFAVWGALLNACCIHQQVKLGEYLAKKLFLLDNRSGGFYVLMSNLYAIKGKWDEVAKVRRMMRETGGDGYSGISVIEITSLDSTNTTFSSDVSLERSLL
ncbi:Tetratricopeptide-like helical domain containing protein [Parasponia andersonii]|uniref:Tetratricopeptide-like helical domain containing protein n=1 Tax=Parasponia andersonii TaxID=3476 RepID=A0A2P5B0P0_PARAD|nr:Tetratricopeptide-like helical domain containing protein [Parasponia andersonii]